jgi:serine/threonine protein kinase
MDKIVPMEIINDFVYEEELYPRWFKDTECKEQCRVCEVQVEEKKGYDRGTFGVVRFKDNVAQKIISHRDGIICSSAIREFVTLNRMGTCCPQLVQCLLPVNFDERGNTYITMERAELSLLNFSRCSKLRQTVCGYERMSVHYVLWSLLKAVTHLNECQIMHRDIKPGNVLVFPGPRVVLCDYGACRLTHAQLDSCDFYMSDSVCTKHYSPPEEASGKHNSVFDTFSIVATVVHYTMSGAPMYQPMSKVNRKTFQKICKPFPHLMNILKLMCKKKPEQRVTAFEALKMFEEMYPVLVKRFTTYFVYKGTVHVPLSVPPILFSWERFHSLSTTVWPCILEGINLCQKTFQMDGTIGIVVAFHVINMLHNLHESGRTCTEEHCYIMYIPTIVRTAILLTGTASDEDDTLTICFDLLKKHFCVFKENDCEKDGLLTASLLSLMPMNWILPVNLTTVIELQERFNL